MPTLDQTQEFKEPFGKADEYIDLKNDQSPVTIQFKKNNAVNVEVGGVQGKHTVQINPKSSSLTKVVLFLQTYFDSFPIQNRIAFINGLNQTDSFDDDSLNKLNELISYIFDELNHGRIVHPLSIVKTFAHEDPSSSFVELKQEENDKNKLDPVVFSEGIRRGLFSDTDDINKQSALCSEFLINLTLYVIYNRLIKLSEIIDENPNKFPNSKYKIESAKIKYGVFGTLSDKNFLTNTVFYGVNKIKDDRKCKNKWEIQSYLGGGVSGHAYTTCCKSNCPYITKIFREETKSIDQEIKISEIASTLGYAPKIHYAGRRTCDINGWCVGIMIMDKMDYSLENIMDKYADSTSDSEITELYEYITNLLDQMIENGIIHMDAHTGNIMFKCAVDGQNNIAYQSIKNLNNAIGQGSCEIQVIDYGYAITNDDFKNMKFDEIVSRYEHFEKKERFANTGRSILSIKETRNNSALKDLFVYYTLALLYISLNEFKKIDLYEKFIRSLENRLLGSHGTFIDNEKKKKKKGK